LTGLDKLPIKAPHHSIIEEIPPKAPVGAIRGTDGVVPYRSAHLDSAESEKIIPHWHTGYQNPESIAVLFLKTDLDKSARTKVQ
jgi:hypothetical protein